MYKYICIFHTWNFHFQSGPLCQKAVSSYWKKCRVSAWQQLCGPVHIYHPRLSKSLQMLWLSVWESKSCASESLRVLCYEMMLWIRGHCYFAKIRIIIISSMHQSVCAAPQINPLHSKWSAASSRTLSRSILSCCRSRCMLASQDCRGLPSRLRQSARY